MDKYIATIAEPMNSDCTLNSIQITIDGCVAIAMNQDLTIVRERIHYFVIDLLFCYGWVSNVICRLTVGSDKIGLRQPSRFTLWRTIDGQLYSSNAKAIGVANTLIAGTTVVRRCGHLIFNGIVKVKRDVDR